jgi:hypothetical protein
MKAEILMLVPETAKDFRTTLGSLRSLDESKGVSFHTFFALGESIRAHVV